MHSSEDKKRLKLLQLAQAILVEESSKRFNESYNQWIRTNGAMGRTTGITPPVPVPPPQPTEAEIVAKALSFYQTSQRAAVNPSITPLPPPPSSVEEQLALVEIASTGAPVSIANEGAAESVIAEVAVEEEPDPPEGVVLDPIHSVHKIFQSPVDESPRFKELFTTWLQRNSAKQGATA